MYEPGWFFVSSLAEACKQEDEQRIKRRFDAAATANSLDEFSYHLRVGSVDESTGCPLDYPSPEEFIGFNFRGTKPDKIAMGRDFAKQ